MTDFLQLLFSGLATGAIYALVALGFTLLWQASGTINFAQGEFVMVPAIVMVIALHMGVQIIPAFIMACVFSTVVLGWAFKRGLVDPLFKHGMMPIVVATIGLSFVLRNGVRAGYSAEPQPFPQIFPDDIYNIGGVILSATDVGTVVVAGLLIWAAQAFLSKTVTGRAMQAVAQNTESATVLGINVPRMILYTFAINALLAAAAALLVTPTFLAKFDMGELLGTKGVLRRHHRRLYQLPRRFGGGLIGGCVGEHGCRIHLTCIQRRGCVGRLHVCDHVPTARTPWS